MKLVGAHHAANLIAPALLIVSRDARPEARDFKDQFGAMVLQKFDVVRDLIILPDVIGDGAAYMALQVGIVLYPAFGMRVQIELLGFLLPVASALPGKHGSPKSRPGGRGPGFVQASVAIHQQRPGDFGHAKIEKGENEQLIPEDMALIVFPGPAAGGHADIETDGVRRHCLQQMQHVQAKQHRDIQLKPGAGRLELHVEATP